LRKKHWEEFRSRRVQKVGRKMEGEETEGFVSQELEYNVIFILVKNGGKIATDNCVGYCGRNVE
jgi:hypothetical protein